MEKPYTIAEIRNRITTTAQQYGIQRAYLFGSYARGEAEHDSDIDICIEKGKIRTLLDLSGFYLDLEKSLQHKVDVVTTDGIDKDFKNEIEKEFVVIYG